MEKHSDLIPAEGFIATYISPNAKGHNSASWSHAFHKKSKNESTKLELHSSPKDLSNEEKLISDVRVFSTTERRRKF